MRLRNVGEFASAVGVHPRAVERWVSHGIVCPSIRQTRKGGRHLFSPVDVLAVALARELRIRGFRLDETSAPLQFLAGRNLRDLRREWIAGRTHVVCVAGRASPWLHAAEAIDKSDLDRLQSDGHRVAIIDLQKTYTQLTASLGTSDLVVHSLSAGNPQSELVDDDESSENPDGVSRESTPAPQPTCKGRL
jgi:DNA-binding transcriptional MerR regulator